MKNRKNRVYHPNSFNVDNLHNAGILQEERIAKYDRVTLDESLNDSIELFGFNQSGSHFSLNLSIVSLYPESRWRLAKVNFNYQDSQDNCNYSYSNEQLLDYEAKRSSSEQHETKNIYKIGSLSIETVLPFALSRILFNGMLTKTKEGVKELIPVRLSISTHPTCDKFDYMDKFDEEYLKRILKESPGAGLSLLTEDRIEQPFMFQSKLELLETNSSMRSVFWGAKIKQFVNPKLVLEAQVYDLKESIFFWAECGHQIHLHRSLRYPNLVIGMVHSGYNYASYLYDLKVLRKNGDKFEDLRVDSFSDLTQDNKIVIRAFKVKEYTVEFLEPSTDIANKLFKVTINGFDGWGCVSDHNLSQEVRTAQANLWTLDIDDRYLSFKLACEPLLGGKGNSLVQLRSLVSRQSLLCLTEQDDSCSVKISVPRGLVVSCVAYKMWLDSNSGIEAAIQKLDRARRNLAARSVYQNPFVDKHLSLGEKQRLLKSYCDETCATLKSFPIPATLRKHLQLKLEKIFSDDDLKGNKLFAVRSSAVGEDSLETSAAGQMKTLLDVQGFDAICQAIVDCWSSQFDIEALTYKSQNGMVFNFPMAVVVQELIQCQVAGVAATCDPLTGDKSKLEILANVGLGEGVVSGKQTDTIKVSLKHLSWNKDTEEHVGYLTESGAIEHITKLVNGSEADHCCLTNSQIVQLANLLLRIRQTSEVKEREIEWGITFSESTSSSSSDSSSSSSSFEIHLLQSRPLTHLARLDSHEIDHSLDFGFVCPLEIVSRANLGEVMPGALCPLNSTYFMPILSSHERGKPFEPNHTKIPFTPDSFSFYGQLITMVLSSSEVTSRFRGARSEQHEAALRSMVGTTAVSEEDRESVERLITERFNPLSFVRHNGLGTILALDSGLLKVLTLNAKRIDRKVNFEASGAKAHLDSLIDRLEWSQLGTGSEECCVDVGQVSRCLFDKLCTQVKPIAEAWNIHIRTTLLSMGFNMMCMQLLASQPSYPSIVNSTEVLNDFSVLIQGGENTEGADMSKLLSKFVDTIVEQKQLEKCKSMDHKELYHWLESQAFYKDFMRKNGHRAFKEFDFSTLTWQDDPSFIIKSLELRLKQYNESGLQKELEVRKQREQEHKVKVNQILNKVERGRAILVNYLLPRARNAVVRREHSKSHLIKVVDKYRQAFRCLATLLCLRGRLPSVDLIFQLSIDELNTVVNGERADLPRIFYKARRRQQRIRILNQVTFDRPVIRFMDMVETVRKVTDPSSEAPKINGFKEDQSGKTMVSGMTSCAGLVTGRACVITSLEDIDQLEPNDILITYSIDISWSVYFFTLAGIVTEVGGIVSHGAVVAREYGIPTLCTAINACSTFKTGQIVTLDANSGVCYLATDQSKLIDK